MRPPYLKDHDLITLEDGFIYFDVTDERGAISSYQLREIADYLDEINESWRLEMNRVLDELSNEHGRVIDIYNKQED